MDKTYSQTHDECPACGKTERFFESILKELKGKGLIEPNITQFSFQIMQGILLDEAKIKALSFQDDLPGFFLIWDFCADCGCQYAVRLERKVAKKKPSLLIPGLNQNVLMNRAQRRRSERENLGNN